MMVVYVVADGIGFGSVSFGSVVGSARSVDSTIDAARGE